MGKRITQRARGKGSLTFRVRPSAYRYRIGYPKLCNEGKAIVSAIINSPAHSAPLAKITINNDSCYNPATVGMYQGQEINIGTEIKEGNIVKLKDIPSGTKVYSVEKVPGHGGVFIRSAGCCAIVMTQEGNFVEIQIRRRKLKINKECRATIGVIAGDGRMMKPFVKAGKKHYLMLSKGRKWHRTSAVKTNPVDHPFGSGRGKRIKSKIAKRNAPPGAKVGHIKPSRTGKPK
jgi:large subunit ribosomal protein L2